jgi:hypothetical protein
MVFMQVKLSHHPLTQLRSRHLDLPRCGRAVVSQHPVEVSTAILLGTALLLSPYLLAGARGSRRQHCANIILVAIGTTINGA